MAELAHSAEYNGAGGAAVSRARLLVCGFLMALGLSGLAVGAVAAQGNGTVLVAPVSGIINPVLADYVGRVIGVAEQRNAAAIVLQLDTPGGLDSSMRQVIQRILSSRVPVIVYVAPPGSRAGSAGVYVTYAAHVSAMAPNTNIGSATPVMFGEGGEAKVSEEMRAKINNDAVAYIRGLAEQRGRNAEWAERAVRQGENVAASEAVTLRVVDLMAADVRQLLDQVDGRVLDVSGSRVTLKTAGVTLETVEMSAFESFLHVISNPTIAYILLSLGSLGLMLELYNPGQVLPGVVGGVCLLLAFYSLGTLPINYAGLLLMGFAFLLFIADVFSPTHGVLTVGGIIAFALGSFMLFSTPDGAPYWRVSIYAILAMTGTLAAFLLFVVGAIVRSRGRRVVTGREGLIGSLVGVRTALDPEGYVLAESELWRARSTSRAILAGEKARVITVDGLLLQVAPEMDGGQPSEQSTVPVTAAPGDQPARTPVEG